MNKWSSVFGKDDIEKMVIRKGWELGVGKNVYNVCSCEYLVFMG